MQDEKMMERMNGWMNEERKEGSVDDCQTKTIDQLDKKNKKN